MSLLIQRTCRNSLCAATFIIRATDAKRGRGLFCCKRCKAVEQGRNKEIKLCSHPNCLNKHFAKGVCQNHYNKLPEVRAKHNAYDKTPTRLATRNARRNKQRASETHKKWKQTPAGIRHSRYARFNLPTSLPEEFVVFAENISQLRRVRREPRQAK